MRLKSGDVPLKHYAAMDKPQFQEIVKEMLEYSALEDELPAYLLITLITEWWDKPAEIFGAYVHGALMFSGYSDDVNSELDFLRAVKWLKE